MPGVVLGVMKSVNAVASRQSVSKVVAQLEKGGHPILLMRGKKPVAALVSLQDFEERFVEQAATLAREQLLTDMRALVRRSADAVSAVESLRQLREGRVG